MTIRLLLLLSVGFLLQASEFKRYTFYETTDIVVLEEEYDVYDSKGTVARFYKEERNGDLKHLFNFTLEDKTGTCGARSVEEGFYEINATDIVLYTSWDRQGRVYDVPYGFRRAHYHVNKDGSIARKESKIYVETTTKSYDRSSAMRFLFTPPKTKEEKNALQEYINNAQRRFKGDFVLGKEMKTLQTEVESALKRKMEKRWR